MPGPIGISDGPLRLEAIVGGCLEIDPYRV